MVYLFRKFPTSDYFELQWYSGTVSRTFSVLGCHEIIAHTNRTGKRKSGCVIIYVLLYYL